MNINNIINDLDLNYKNMNIDNYAYIDNRINYNIIKKIFKSYHTEKKDVYFRFFPFYIINEKEKYDFNKYKYDDKKNEDYIMSFIVKIFEKIDNKNIYEIIKKKKYIDEMIIKIDDYYNEQLKEKIDNEIKKLKLELELEEIKQLEEKKQLKLEEIKKLEKDKNLLNGYLSYDNYKIILEYNDEITKLNVNEEEDNIIIYIKLEEDNIIIDIKLEEENEKLKKKLENEKQLKLKDIIQLEEEIKKLKEEEKKYDNIENYEGKKNNAMSEIFNKYKSLKILNENVKLDVKNELFQILIKNNVLKSYTEIYELFEKHESDTEIYEFLNIKKETIKNENIKIIFDIYISLIKKQFYINLYEEILGEKYSNKNNLEELLNKKININDYYSNDNYDNYYLDLIKDYFNMLITKNKYEKEYEKYKKEIENSKIKLKNKLQKKLKTPYFKREDLNYINLFKINDKTPINLGTYEVSGEKVDKKEFEIILCSKSDYKKKIDEINGNYNFNDNNIFFIKIYDKEKISDNMEDKYSYFVGENILQKDGYIYTNEFNFITNSIITDYNTSEDYYEGYIKKIIEKDILNDKLLSYISTYNFYPFITETFILYNKYLSIFDRKLKIKIKNAYGLNTKISEVMNNNELKTLTLEELNNDLQKYQQELYNLKNKYNFDNDLKTHQIINFLNKKITEKRNEQMKKEVQKKQSISDNYTEISNIEKDIINIKKLNINIKKLNKQILNINININIKTIDIQNKIYEINEFENIIYLLDLYNIEYNIFIDYINIVTNEDIELKIMNEKLDLKDLQYKKTINEIYNKKDRSLSEYFFLCIISDILNNNYNNYNEKKYLCIDNFYVDALGNYLYIDRIF